MSEASISDAILVDEIGIETGAYDRYRLKTSYQPIFSPAGDQLVVAAVDAATAVRLHGEPANFSDLARSPEPVDQRFLSRLCQSLHIDNYRNLSIPDCGLFLDHDLSENRRLLDAVLNAHRQARAMGESGVDATRLVCRIANATTLSEVETLGAMEELRGAGVRLAFDVFDNPFQSGEAAARFRPDVAEIGETWLSKIMAENSAAKLLKPLVAAHKRDGTSVFVRGIATADQLEMALEAGVDYVSGDLLGPPVLAGMVMDDAPKSIGALLRRPLTPAARAG